MMRLRVKLIPIKYQTYMRIDDFDGENREVTIVFTLDEWDLLQCFKHSALPKMQPMSTDGELYKFYRKLQDINHQLAMERIKRP